MTVWSQRLTERRIRPTNLINAIAHPDPPVYPFSQFSIRNQQILPFKENKKKMIKKLRAWPSFAT